MKKILLLLIAFSLLLTGCYSSHISNELQTTASENPESIIPFLTYYNNEDRSEVKAKLSYWDVKNSKVNFTDNKVYTAFLNVNNRVNPIMWDGANKIVLFKNCLPDATYKENAKVIKEYTQDTVYGRDIEAKRNMDEKDSRKNKDYTLFLKNQSRVIQKKATFLFTTKDEANNDVAVGEFDIPSYVDYNTQTGEITFIFKYFFQTHASLFVAKCNINSIKEVDWQEIKLSKDIIAGGGLTPYPINSALIGSKYYIQSSGSFAEVDLDKKISKLLLDVNNTCRSIVKEGKYVPDHIKEILPIGSYNNILILQVPISSDIGLEYVICAFKENSFMGAIHLRTDDTWSIINKDRQKIDEITQTSHIENVL